MKTNSFEPLILLPSKRRWGAVLAIGLALMAASLFSIRDQPAVGWISLAFFGACTLVAAVQLLPGASALKLDQEGFVVRNLFREWRTRWEDIGPFRVVRLVFWHMVGFDRVIPAGGNPVARINSTLVGAAETLPETYGLAPERLAALMNEWRDRASRQGAEARSDR